MLRTTGGAGLVLALCLLASAADKSRVYDPPKALEDARLQPRDLNKPWEFTPQFTKKEDWEKRARELREQVLVSTGLWPLPERTPLGAVVHGKIDRDEYTIEKVFFASYPGHYVSGNLYRPKPREGCKPAGGKYPAVLSPHGHWANGRFYERPEAEVKKEIESGAEKTPEGARYPLQARCAMLARLGCVVFHYDMVGVADSSKPIGHTFGFTDVDAELRLQSFLGLQTWNSVRALDFLAGLPDVDPARIAVTGASGGGTQTFMLCAIDDRPAVSFPAVMVSTEMQGGCICENCSGLRVGTNNIELAALFAPKPQAMTGADDWTRRIETSGLPELKTIYGLYGAADKVNAKYYPFPHNYNQVSREMMYNWLNTHLKLGHAGPIVEKPFVPVPPRELSVYDDQHPRPADARDAAGLRKVITEQSDRQLAELAKDPAAYRRTLGTALRHMVHDALPENVKIVPQAFRELKGEGCRIHKSVLSREGSGAKLPSIGLVPTAWNRTIVIWAHPEGKASLLDAEGRPTPLVRRLLDQDMAVMAGDLYLTGEFHQPDKRTPAPPVNDRYAGYTFGYNRSVLANRVHDLLTLVALAKRQGATRIHLVGFEQSGPAVLLARALAGDRVQKAVIDLHGFDFDQLKATNDEMMLPGALKYGGVAGFASLCSSGETLLHNGREPKAAVATPAVSFAREKQGPEEAVGWLLK